MPSEVCRALRVTLEYGCVYRPHQAGGRLHPLRSLLSHRHHLCKGWHGSVPDEPPYPGHSPMVIGCWTLSEIELTGRWVGVDEVDELAIACERTGLPVKGLKPHGGTEDDLDVFERVLCRFQSLVCLTLAEPITLPIKVVNKLVRKYSRPETSAPKGGLRSLILSAHNWRDQDLAELVDWVPNSTLEVVSLGGSRREFSDPANHLPESKEWQFSRARMLGHRNRKVRRILEAARLAAATPQWTVLHGKAADPNQPAPLASLPLEIKMMITDHLGEDRAMQAYYDHLDAHEFWVHANEAYGSW